MAYYQPVKPLNRFWLCPLPAIDEGHICVPKGYEPANLEPENLSVVERKLYEVNPADREWLAEYFAPLPHYLTKYFANRYVSIFNKQGRFPANTFIREKMVPAHKRVLLVLEQYKQLPTTSKVALLSDAVDEENSTQQNNFEHA